MTHVNEWYAQLRPSPQHTRVLIKALLEWSGDCMYAVMHVSQSYLESLT